MSETRKPTMLEALIPVVSLIAMLGLSVYVFSDSSSSGPNQIVLTIAAGIAALVGMRLGYTWGELQRAMIAGISTSISLCRTAPSSISALP